MTVSTSFAIGPVMDHDVIALSARLNLIMPNETKRRIMHAVSPHKKGDGLPAHYDRCLHSAIRGTARSHGLEMIAEKRNYRLTDFDFLLPLYLAWRGTSVFQYLFDGEYCENFEMVLDKTVDLAGP